MTVSVTLDSKAAFATNVHYFEGMPAGLEKAQKDVLNYVRGAIKEDAQLAVDVVAKGKSYEIIVKVKYDQYEYKAVQRAERLATNISALLNSIDGKNAAAGFSTRAIAWSDYDLP